MALRLLSLSLVRLRKIIRLSFDELQMKVMRLVATGGRTIWFTK